MVKLRLSTADRTYAVSRIALGVSDAAQPHRQPQDQSDRRVEDVSMTHYESLNAKSPFTGGEEALRGPQLYLGARCARKHRSSYTPLEVPSSFENGSRRLSGVNTEGALALGGLT